MEGGRPGTLIYELTRLESTKSDLAYTSNLSLDKLLTGSSPGTGSGFDVGFTYEFRPKADQFRYRMDGKIGSDVTKTKYLLRFDVALLDIGAIRYKNVTNTRAVNLNGALGQKDFSSFKNSAEAHNRLLSVFSGRATDETLLELETKLPQTLIVQADLQLGKGWFVGSAWVLPTKPSATALPRATLLTLGPRYESSGFEWSLMGNYWKDAGKFALASHVRLGVFTIGSDNVLGFFSNNGLNASAFAGVMIPFLAKRQKDGDGDYVSNRRDKCPDVAGIWTFKGCPDTDNDGIQDQDDACPQEAGLAATKGCLDADGDGIFDKNDACPNEAGSVKFNGCPDTDNDGIANGDDECPTVSGVAAFGGCPDTDGDGLRDSQDTCPNEAGLKELDGCALKNLTSTDARLSAEENSLINQLATAWAKGALRDSTARSTA